MHRIFALFFCMALAVLALTIPAGAEAVTGTCGDGIEWTYEDGTLTVSGSGPMENFEALAPWDDYRGEITKAVISDGITTVGDNAFRDYDALQEVSIGNNVTTLGKGSFLGCDALVRIHLPSSFRVFDEECLRDCKKLTAIHCEGTFPSFRLNCLWGSSVKIYYPASRPWPVKLVQELEENFGGRIEFLDSDGNDPYTPEKPTETTAEAATEATTQPTTEPAAQLPTEPETLPATEPVTVPTTAPEETTQAATEASFPYTMPTEPPEEEAPRRSGAGVGLALIGLVLCGVGLGMLVFRRPKKGGKYIR